MHYYQFNIGDYRKDTSFLSLLEHGIYRSLLDTYYLNESPLCEDLADLMRTHCVRTEEEKNAFNFVLSKFFILTKKGYKHKRCDEAISKYNEKSEKARASAKKRWDANALQTHNEGNANHKPITNNHKPITKEKNTRGTRLPKDWKLTQEFYEAAKLIKPGYTDQQINFCADGFRDYWISKSGSGATKVDWLATWRNWLRRQREQNHVKRKESLAEQRERETAEILADIDSGKFDNGALGSNGATVWPQMEFPGGSEENGERAIDAEFSVVVPEDRTPDRT